MTELIEWGEAFASIAASDEQRRVARETLRVAGDCGDYRDNGLGERPRLRFGSSARRVKDDRGKPRKFLFAERPAKKISRFDRCRAET
jgi:hypothetical protein